MTRMDKTRIDVETILQEAMLDAYNLEDVRCVAYDWTQGNPNDYDLQECYWGPDDLEPLLGLLDNATPPARRVLVARIVAGIKAAN